VKESLARKLRAANISGIVAVEIESRNMELMLLTLFSKNTE
jgi:hypothetical protein